MENLIEELTKVNPSNLSEEGLKLFNKINEIIDRNEELEKENKTFKNVISEIFNGEDTTDKFIPKSLIKEKIEELDIKITYIESQYRNGGQNCDSNYLGALYQKQVLEELLK